MDQEYNHESLLVEVLPQIENLDNLDSIKQIVIDYVTSSNIKGEDEKRIISNIRDIKNREKFDKYLYNSILFFEGHTLNQKKKKKKRKKKTKVNYFTRETEDAIILYNKLSNGDERSKLYENKIHYPFFKLTQNIIHTFDFYQTDVEDLEDLQHEIEVFLLGKIHFYSHVNNLEKRFLKAITKEFGLSGPPIIVLMNSFGYYKITYPNRFCDYVGEVDRVDQEDINSFIETLDVSDECRERLLKFTPPKAYSYFGTITKRWLITYTEKNYKDKLQNTPVEEVQWGDNHSYNMGEGFEKDKLSYFMDKFIDNMSDNLYDYFPKERDAKVADALLELFRKRDNIEIFQKKALYINLREMGDFKAPKITKISKKMYEVFKIQYLFYLEHGYTKF